MKKLYRALQFLAPKLADLRYDIQDSVLGWLKKPWRRDVLGLRHFDHAKPSILDIGANRGFFVSAAQMINRQARIVAFEPLRWLANRLRQRHSVEKSSQISVEAVALGSGESEVPLYVPFYRGSAFDALSSLNYDEAANWLNSERILVQSRGAAC